MIWNILLFVVGGLLLFLFIGGIMCLFIASGRISEQEERINGTCKESQAGFDLFS